VKRRQFIARLGGRGDSDQIKIDAKGEEGNLHSFAAVFW
jgi:hypothetical protein